MSGHLSPNPVLFAVLFAVPLWSFNLFWFVGICLGHAAIAVWSHNWWYGANIPRRLADGIRFLHYLAIVAGPVAFWLAFRFDPSALFRSEAESALPYATSEWQIALAGYVLICSIVGMGIVPFQLIVRRLYKPAALVNNHTEVVDVAKRLGHFPVGRTGRHWLTRLPGNEIFQVALSERTLALARLPAAWEGLSILHLSDLHLWGVPDRSFFYHVMDLCSQWEPDLVAVTGDLVDSSWHHRWIVPVLGRLRWRIGAFAILGNHDFWFDPVLVRRRLRRTGIKVLDNTWACIEVRGEPMIVIGHEGPWFRPRLDLSDCPSGVFRLCLSHTPDNIAWARRNQIDLMLSGHNHGGQIRLPFVGSVFVPSKYGRRFDCGTFDEGPTVLHVSRGLGAEHPIRYNCLPEVTKLVLRKKDDPRPGT